MDISKFGNSKDWQETKENNQRETTTDIWKQRSARKITLPCNYSIVLHTIRSDDNGVVCVTEGL